MRGLVSLTAALLIAPATASVLIVPSITVAPAAYASTSVSSKEAHFSERVLTLVNQRRVNHGLRKVRLNSCVDGFSSDWASSLARRNAFEHSNLYRLLDRCDAAYASENIAKIPPGISPRHLVRLWMHSPDHRHNILSRKPRVSGVAVRWDPDEQSWLAVQNFARR